MLRFLKRSPQQRMQLRILHSTSELHQQLYHLIRRCKCGLRVWIFLFLPGSEFAFIGDITLVHQEHQRW
jgi:hypothetical protein